MAAHSSYSLKAFNSFGLDVQCRYFFSIEDEEALQRLLVDSDFLVLRERYPDFVILGKGSNMLFTKDIQGIVLHIAIGGIQRLEETVEQVCVRVGAGVEWRSFVDFAVQQGWGGIENLSCIPGSVGAAPVQNIGAYGVEVSSVVYLVRAYDLEQHRMVQFTQSECRFGYRESIFKREGRNRYIITAVDFMLSKKHHLHLEYGAIREVLATLGSDTPTIADVSTVICRIRASKLPSPEALGNAGSFFKNPVITNPLMERLRARYPDIPYHAATNGFKVPAGWLIERAGWKGYREGDAGCYEKQALVLVNYGNASGKEILSLAHKIQDAVYHQFGIMLEPEVHIFS